MSEKKTPAIRFKGFTDEWEQRKLEDIAERIIRKNTNLESTLPLTISAQYGLIDQSEFFNKRIASKDISVYYLLKKGEFAYNKSTSADAPFGAIKKLDRYNSGVLSTLYILFRIRDERKIDSNYISAYYDTVIWHKDIQNIAAEGARNHGLLNIAPKDFFETKLQLPSALLEQTKIGDYFRILNYLIAINQRKLTKLQLLKKSMLTKMFPKDGALVPEIRFQGFHGDWEQCTLGDIAEHITRKNTNLESTMPLTISAQYGLIDQSEFFDKRIASKDIRGYYLLKKGEFAYNKSTSADAPFGAIKKLNRYNSGVLSNLYILFRIRDERKIDSNYISAYYDTAIWHNEIQHIATEGARNHGLLNISPKDFFETKLQVPSTLLEQKKIGEYFCNIGHRIALHQRKLSKLQQIKQAMLSKLFV